MSEIDKTGVHMAHCYQGEQWGWCKYGDEDCPAKPDKRSFTVVVKTEDGIVSETFVSVRTQVTEADQLTEIVLCEAQVETAARLGW